MLKRLVAGFLLSSTCLLTALPAHADYPERNIQAVVPWSPGGATDNVARSLAALVEKELGQSLIISNRPGGTGVIGTSFVMKQRPDGYTLLIGAENPQLYPLLGLAKFDYSGLDLISLIGQNMAVIATPPDSPWNSMEELLADAKANPGKLRMGSTGAGGLPGSVHAMISSIQPLDVREVTFAGDGPGVAALLGKHIDFMPLSMAAAREQIAAGKLKGLAVFGTEELEGLPGVPPITKALPEIASYLPWGPFWGVWVRKGTPEPIKQKLTDAFSKTLATPEAQAFIKNFGATPLNLSGAEAQAYLDRWQSVTTWSMYKAGAVKVSPESLGIPKP
ncbi:tripartite tricarboxylate transporter substrate binding protein [Pseudomonas sp. RL_15y_Pfl2_60]|uniref:tripartite tricarboxylate transporter substrate binding protein n=1 Tax=Pseudomonas sp. RL_15y_Pfl2_60 TaxID=3088709 RepID=UPI0030DAB885